MKKPKLIVQKPSLDYMECVDYINQKYNINIDNYANKTYGGKNDGAPYQNFWHLLVDGGIESGKYFEMFLGEPSDYYKDRYRDKMWAQPIYALFKKEFDEYVDDEEFLRFWVEW